MFRWVDVFDGDHTPVGYDFGSGSETMVFSLRWWLKIIVRIFRCRRDGSHQVSAFFGYEPPWFAGSRIDVEPGPHLVPATFTAVGTFDDRDAVFLKLQTEVMIDAKMDRPRGVLGAWVDDECLDPAMQVRAHGYELVAHLACRLPQPDIGKHLVTNMVDGYPVMFPEGDEPVHVVDSVPMDGERRCIAPVE